MAIVLRTRGRDKSDDARFTKRATTAGIADPAKRSDYALIVKGSPRQIGAHDFEGYGAIVATESVAQELDRAITPRVVAVREVDHIAEGHILSIEPRSATVLTVFRPESRHNVIFTTERCNSNCLMCSQPPKDIDDSWRIDEHLKVISLIGKRRFQATALRVAADG